MAEEVAQPLTNEAEKRITPREGELAYVHEVVLKRRKTNEELALRRKEQLEQRNFKSQQNKLEFIKKPEDFVKEYRYREMDLVHMKHRLRRKRPPLWATNSQLLLVSRIQGKNDMHPVVRKGLYSLGLRKIFNAVFVKSNESIMETLLKVQPYVAYGCPNLKNTRELIFKKGFARIDKKKVPLTDNNLIEQALGKYDIICLEDIVHEIATIGPYFKEVTSFLWPFMLNKPDVVLKGSKMAYKDGGDAGDRGDKINELISKMN